MRASERNDDTSMVGRIAAILNAFQPRDDDLGISELARRTGLPKSTVSRIITGLVEHQFLERAGTGVRLGLRLFELGESATRPRDLRKLALASMSDLRNAVNLTVHLAVLEGTEVVYIEILPARDTPPLPSRVGGRMPAHATGVGKALVAWSSPDVIETVLSGGLVARGPNTITDPERFKRELSRIRNAGVAYEREESGPGVACAATAVRSADGHPVVALSAAGWSRDFDVRRVGFAVQTAAQGLSRQIARRPGLRL
ncbi:IclR family transcriptional regulator [Agreia sp.]|uniref:IclR family transcriptional regulator n=1 Tax=Agreia sp. TaxID=1872416 RepID=UPI0035BC1776